MNQFSKTLVAGALSSLTASVAAEDISANIGLASDYMFRGVSQTDSQMALQGGFDWSHASGFYVGTWASNVDSDFFGGAKDPQLEVDLYAGYAAEMGAYSYDLGVLVYVYPGADAPAVDDFQTVEFYIGGGYAVNDALSLSAKLSYADELNFAGVSESGMYFSIGAEYALMENLTLSANLGYSGGDAFETLGGPTGPDSYMDYSVGVSTSFAGADFALAYIDSDDDAEDLFGAGLTDGRAVLTISKSF
ncbi:MAG: TorF family putative porin [Gammaproteobacteria bacterium]